MIDKTLPASSNFPTLLTPPRHEWTKLPARRSSLYPFSQTDFIPAWDSIKTFVPKLRPWKRECWSERSYRGDRHFAELAAILFSIARTATTGKERVYVTRYKGDGCLLAMLNAKSSPRHSCPC